MHIRKSTWNIGVIDWVLPRSEFHTYLRRIVEAGFADRVLFGSDQMVWPDALPIGASPSNSDNSPTR